MRWWNVAAHRGLLEGALPRFSYLPGLLVDSQGDVTRWAKCWAADSALAAPPPPSVYARDDGVGHARQARHSPVKGTALLG